MSHRRKSTQKCPKCGSKDVDWELDEIEWDAYEHSRVVECQTCKATWYEVYNFSHIEEIPQQFGV